jgi:uncharacterized iron-regulated protein
MARRFLLLLMALMTACATLLPSPLPSPLPDVLLLGEQHDEPTHQQWHHRTVGQLIERGKLAAVALEMAEQGRSTAGLAHSASDAEVKTALGWDDKSWPWSAYEPAVMAAVRAGIPVLGANLPPARLREVMADARLDGAVPAAVLQAQHDAVRSGHCDLLPASQVGPMTRVQIARDRTMAQVLGSAARPGQTVLLIAGAKHADPELGVPLHLDGRLQAASRIWPAGPPKQDYCAVMRRQLDKRRPPS